MTALVILFWLSAGLLLYTQAGYAAVLVLLARIRRLSPAVSVAASDPPAVSVIVAAYAEQEVIAGRVANLRALDYPPAQLEVLVACDGSPDATAQRARDAGADVVLELSRGGKIRAQDAAVARARGDILAFSDANVRWAAGALSELVVPFADRRVRHVCGHVALGHRASSAARRQAYPSGDPDLGHDRAFPFTMVRRGWVGVYAPGARRTEKMV